MRQKGNTVNGSTPAEGAAMAEYGPEPVVVVNDPAAPVKRIDAGELRRLGAQYKGVFDRFAQERQPAEQRWIRNLRQYLGVYDPEIERSLAPNRSRAYPRLTRVKCVSMLSRLMNLMFPGNEDNWELNASPSPEMSPEAVAQAVEELMAELGAAPDEPLTQERVGEAVRRLAEKQAKQLTMLVKDQLTELGGDQSCDWVALNRKVVDSGIKYGIGLLEGPYVRKVQVSGWMLQAEPTQLPDGTMAAGQFVSTQRTVFKPQFDHLPVWDFYPDMSARELPGEGYFVRKILGRSKLRKLADRADFFGDQIKQVITQKPGGNYRQKSWETDLRSIGVSSNAETTSAQSSERAKYEIIIWKGPVSGETLAQCGVDVPEDMRCDDVDAELWMIDDYVVKADVNAWRKLGVDMRQVHVFRFDDDDTSPIGQGLPQIVRDSQLSICASTRMVLDNASVTCGPNLEVNTGLMRADQDLSAVEPYKIWYRDDTGMSAQFPAVRELNINGHINELQALVKMFMDFAEVETFIGQSTGGDFQRMPSEPMRTAAGASMLRGDAALPFKDIVRNYDSFTQSAIWSIVTFNKKFNPDEAPEGDYNVVARGATSLIAKEVRGMQIDMLSQTLTPDERDHIDERRFVEARFAARDMQGMLVSPDEAERRKAARAEEAAKQSELQTRMVEANIREVASEAYKNIAQGQRNSANADQIGIKSAMTMIEAGEVPNEPQNPADGRGQQAPRRG